MICGYGFGVELYAVDGFCDVLDAHDGAVIGLCCDGEIGRAGGVFDDEGVVAGYGVGAWDVLENSGAGMGDL